MKVGNFIETRELTPEEAAEYRKLKPGTYQTKDRIRTVAIENGIMSVLDITQNMELTRLRVE